MNVHTVAHARRYSDRLANMRAGEIAYDRAAQGEETAP